MHVFARPDVFHPCDELLTVEEYGAMQKNDSFFLFTAKTIGDETAGLCFAKLTETDSPRPQKENSVYRRFLLYRNLFVVRNRRMLYAKVKETAACLEPPVELTVWNFNEKRGFLFTALGMQVQFAHMEENIKENLISLTLYLYTPYSETERRRRDDDQRCGTADRHYASEYPFL